MFGAIILVLGYFSMRAIVIFCPVHSFILADMIDIFIVTFGLKCLLQLRLLFKLCFVCLLESWPPRSQISLTYLSGPWVTSFPTTHDSRPYLSGCSLASLHSPLHVTTPVCSSLGACKINPAHRLAEYPWNKSKEVKVVSIREPKNLPIMIKAGWYLQILYISK